LLQQAIRLSQDPNTSAGASLVLQNRNVLGLPIETPEPPVRPTRRRAEREQAPRTPVDRREVVSSPGGFPEMIARNIIDRGESLGINRAIFNTVSEIRVSDPSSYGILSHRALEKHHRDPDTVRIYTLQLWFLDKSPNTLQLAK
jgi:TBC1 domain family protein 5